MRRMFVACLLVCLGCISAWAGEIRGQIGFESELPARHTRGDQGKSMRQLEKQDGYDRDFLVKENRIGGGLPEGTQVNEHTFVVVHLTEKADGARLRATPGKTQIDQRDRQFKPHVVPVVLGSEVAFFNNDSYFHHIFSPSKFEIRKFLKGQRYEKPSKLGAYELFCNIHPRMNAYLYVVPNDFYVMADSEGRYRLKAVPPGRYVLRAWHPRLQAKEVEITVRGEDTQEANFRL